MGFSGETLVGGAGGAGEVIFRSVACGGAVGGAAISILSNSKESAGVLGNSASSRQRSGASAIIAQRNGSRNVIRSRIE